MLVLTRTRGERIAIGEDIVIEVLDIIGNKVRLGISAPPEVPVHRTEVADALKRDGRMFIRSGGSHSGATPLEKIATTTGHPLKRRDD